MLAELAFLPLTPRMLASSLWIPTHVTVCRLRMPFGLSSPNENDFLQSNNNLAAVSFRDGAGQPGTVASRPVHYPGY